MPAEGSSAAAAVRCPPPEVLQKLLLGGLTGAEAEALASHLAHCTGCLEAVETLSVSDMLVELVRVERAQRGVPTDDALPALLDRLRGEAPRQEPAAATQVTVGLESQYGTMLPSADAIVAAEEERYEFLTPPQREGEIGRLGVYRVLRVLGTGGMGVVFLGEDMVLHRAVALKAMLPRLAANESARQRFVREARAVAAIEHDNIVTIYQVDEQNGVPFLAMPLLRGESLLNRLKEKGPLPLRDVLRIGRETAAGLAAAHERGLIHRDIKPANLWLEGGSGRVKILDFGLVRSVADPVPLAGGDDTIASFVPPPAAADLTLSGAIVGTPAYMAPEQVEGRPVDHRADLFSLGCVLYRMATGEPPFKGNDAQSTMMAVVRAEPAMPQTLNPDLPPAIASLIVRLLAKDPAARPASARAVIDAIDEAQAPVFPAEMLVTGTQTELAIMQESKPIPVLQAVAPKSQPTITLLPGTPRPEKRPALPPFKYHLWLPILGAALAMVCVFGVLGCWVVPPAYRFVMNRGKLVVEVKDDNVMNALTRREVSLRHATSNEKIVLRPGPQDVPGGTYHIETAGNLRLSPTTVTVGRNGVERIRLSAAAGP